MASYSKVPKCHNDVVNSALWASLNYFNGSRSLSHAAVCFCNLRHRWALTAPFQTALSHGQRGAIGWRPKRAVGSGISAVYQFPEPRLGWIGLKILEHSGGGFELRVLPY